MFMPISRGKVAVVVAAAAVPVRGSLVAAPPSRIQSPDFTPAAFASRAPVVALSPAVAVPPVETRNSPAAARITLNTLPSCGPITVTPLIHPMRLSDYCDGMAVSIFRIPSWSILSRCTTIRPLAGRSSRDEPRLSDRPDLQPQGDDPGCDRKRAAADFLGLGADRGGRRFHR